ncbi:MAG: SurA N-terminal domain-containing protein [Oscillospiraceae bacterium]|nr:SurA N-terminal domain-containing protein [Oscillospiraceae bacterium]
MKRIITNCLILTLLFTALSGCGGKSAGKTESPSSSAEDAAVARVGSTEIMFSELAEQMVTVEAMYSKLTDQLSAEEIKQKLHEAALTVLNNLVSRQILLNKINEYDVKLTEEETKETEAVWDETVNKITVSLQKSYPDLSGDDLNTMVNYTLASSGLDEAVVIENSALSAKTAKLKDKLLTDIPEPSDGEVLDYYNVLVSEQTSAFRGNPTAFESAALSGDIIVFVPAAYRIIKEISLTFDADVIELLDQLKQIDTEDDTTYEDMLANELSLLNEDVASIRTQYAGGTPFSEIMEKYKTGSGDTVNYVAENSSRFSDSYLEAAMSIGKVGEIGDKLVNTDYGYTVLYWEDSLPAGEIPLADVREQLSHTLVENDRTEKWKELQSAWRNEANVEIFEDALGY